jgi:hypothetical protein
LIRTPDRYRTNADPLDHEAWPHDRRQLLDDLWALALAHLPTMHEYERAVNEKARLTGRNLEPWRAILAVALWLDHHDPHGILQRTTTYVRDDGQEETRQTGLWERLEALSVHYQRERSDLESGNLTVLVIRALWYCAISAIRAISAIDKETPSEFIFTTDQVVLFAMAITKQDDGDPHTITNRIVSRLLGQMRLQKAPRPGGKGSRRWRVTLADLQRWTAAYGLPLPPSLAPPPSD